MPSAWYTNDIFGCGVFSCFHLWMFGLLHAHILKIQPVVYGWFSFSTITLQQTFHWQCQFKWQFGCSNWSVVHSSFVFTSLQIIFVKRSCILCYYFSSGLASTVCILACVSMHCVAVLLLALHLDEYWKVLIDSFRFNSKRIVNSNRIKSKWIEFCGGSIPYKRAPTIHRAVRKLFIL